MRFHRQTAATRRQIKTLTELRRDPHLAKDLGLPPLAPSFKVKTALW